MRLLCKVTTSLAFPLSKLPDTTDSVSTSKPENGSRTFATRHGDFEATLLFSFLAWPRILLGFGGPWG